MAAEATVESILAELQALGNPQAAAEMARFGITPAKLYGISIPALRGLARRLGRNHALAQALWSTGVHEARILASIIADPKQADEALLERWANDFDSWDICDQCCLNLFRRTPYAYSKALEWSARPEEFVKRAGFALMATLGVHDKAAADSTFEPFLDCIVREAGDGRNFVKKAVNWALRQIGKRNPSLNRRAMAAARQIAAMDAPSARWIAADALRELQARFNAEKS